MAEAKRLKTGRWRIYRGPAQRIVRDPSTGTIVTFESLTDARRWWSGLNPGEPLQEAHKCARCGAYFGASTPWTVYAGRPYHLAHAPGAASAATTLAETVHSAPGRQRPLR